MLGDVRLTNLRFADDVLLVSYLLQDIKTILADVDKGRATCGLSLHPGKTKLMTNVRARRGEAVQQFIDIAS
eukprot:2481796-Pyramimonas_sp.AAC.1